MEKNLQKKLELILTTNEDEMISRMVHHADKIILKEQQEYLSTINVSQAQALFIIYLAYHENDITYQNMLEKSFGLTNPTVTASIKSLIKKDILYREKDPDDGRYYRLYLTAYGKTLVEDCADAFIISNIKMSQKLTTEELSELIRLIHKLIA